MSTEFHAMSGEEALSALGSTAQGLTSEEARDRSISYGPNELSEGRKISPLMIFLDQFKDYMVIILIIAALISAGIGLWKESTEEYLDAGIIMVIVLVNAVLGFVQNYRAEKTMQALRDMAAPKANVIRDGKESSVPSRELVPGDIIILSTGDRISADARLLETANLKTNEASLTGESLPVGKNARDVLPSDTLLSERDNMVFSGCTVDHGRGRAVVTSTGMLTQLGNIARMVQYEDEDTPLQKKLDRLGKQLGIMVLGVCVFIFAVGYFRGVAAEEMFLTSVSLAVAAIPEGLPAVVTISLALGLQRMAKRKAVMRKLPAVESLGSATVICTDKTGTLTKGEMNIREIFIGETVNVSGEGFEPQGDFVVQGETIDMAKREDLAMLLVAGALCNDSSLYQEDGKWKVRGDPTEGTLIVTARKAGIDRGRGGQEQPANIRTSVRLGQEAHDHGAPGGRQEDGLHERGGGERRPPLHQAPGSGEGPSRLDKTTADHARQERGDGQPRPAGAGHRDARRHGCSAGGIGPGERLHLPGPGRHDRRPSKGGDGGHAEVPHRRHPGDHDHRRSRADRPGHRRWRWGLPNR